MIFLLTDKKQRIMCYVISQQQMQLAAYVVRS